MFKGLIIVFLLILALIDLVAIFKPDIKRYIEDKKRAKRRKAFGKKMKNLEIK